MEILIGLESYDDLFSDFDIRNFGERTISKDFLDEMTLRMAKVNASDKLKIIFVLTKEQRNEEYEAIIISRISKFFSYRFTRYRQKDRKIKWLSAIFIGFGLLLLVAANFVHNLIPTLFADFLLIPSWFFVWSGLEKYISSREKLNRKKRHYGILRVAKYEFRDK